MSALPTPKLTEAKYLALGCSSPERHQFVDGEICWMTGTTLPYAGIAGGYDGLEFSPATERAQ